MAVSPSVSIRATLMLAFQGREREGDLPQQGRQVLRNHLQKRRVRRRFGVEFQPRRHFHLQVGGMA